MDHGYLLPGSIVTVLNRPVEVATQSRRSGQTIFSEE